MDTFTKARIASERYQMTKKQQLWGFVYKCAYDRWVASGGSSLGDHETMVAALSLGDRFWE